MGSEMADVMNEHEALLQFLYIAPVGLAQTSLDGEIVMINPLSAQLLMPLTQNGCLTNLFTALEGVAPDLRSMTSSFGKSSGVICDALRIQLSAGVRGRSDPHILSLTLLKLHDSRLMAVLSDITEQVKRERLLRHNEAWLNAALTGINDYAVISLDDTGCVDDWNASIGRVTGFKRADVVGQPYSMFYRDGGTTPERILDQLHDANDNGWSLDDGWRLRADGTQFWGNALITPVYVHPDATEERVLTASSMDEEPTSYCLVIRDINDKREEAENLRRSVLCDHLTGIANRRAFFDAAEIEITRWRRSPRPLTMILFDTDHFKQVNDRYGHAAGDAVLRHLAQALTHTFRECDVVARIGGEEFAVLLPSANLAGATSVADRLLQTVAGSAVSVDDAVIHYTVSAGIATMDASVADLNALMKRADDALYSAKRGGRNRVSNGGAA